VTPKSIRAANPKVIIIFFIIYLTSFLLIVLNVCFYEFFYSLLKQGLCQCGGRFNLSLIFNRLIHKGNLNELNLLVF